MSVYVIGDVQGCYTSLQKLIETIQFDPTQDRLWFTGDLVNRGPGSAEVLRWVRALGDRAVTVLGNHDLHLLAVADDSTRVHHRDTLDDILTALDKDELLAWLWQRHLLHHDDILGYTLIHAGLLPQWDMAQARALAREAENALRGEHGFLQQMYGDTPDRWSDELRGFDRWRVILNALTRLRYCDGAGRMDLRSKGTPGTQPAALLPWFQVPGRRSRESRILFGHWSSLGVWQSAGVICLDSGCVWKNALTAVQIDCEPVKFFSVSCAPQQSPFCPN